MSDLRGVQFRAFLKGIIRQYQDFIDNRSRIRTLRSFDKNSQDRKVRFDVFTDFVKYNNYYLTMFLDFLETDSSIFADCKDEALEELTKKSYDVIEKYSGCDREQDYIDMCNQISRSLSTAKNIHKYVKM